ncbi:hypothetical protein [Parasediminibacterium sp. JCM 36343]|uniref:hypothetical protein n=1 Tax=Parasediminibacterium sp. JCM 36343 TaxID=3374279 RepID=UPI003978CB34
MTLNITDIELFALLKAKIGEKEATAVINYVKQETAAAASKTHEYFNKDIANLQSHVDEKFKDMATKDFVQKEISNSKADMMRAMYITSFIQILSIIGGILALAKFIK